MKKLLLVLFLTAFTFSCSSDDDSSSSDQLAEVEGTNWYRQETVTQSGQTFDIDFYLVFQTSDTGYLEAETTASGTNINQTYNFTYVYTPGQGTAEFDDSNIGTQVFIVSGNQLTLDGETLTRQ